MMNVQSECAMCMNPFVTEPKPICYNRVRLNTFTNQRTAQAFCKRTVPMDSFVCRKCVGVIKKNTVCRKAKRVKKKNMYQKRSWILKSEVKPSKNGGLEGLEKAVCSPTPNAESSAQKIPVPHFQENEEGGETIDIPSTSAVSMEIGEEVQDWEDVEGKEETQESRYSSPSPTPPIERVIDYLLDRKYLRALRILCEISPKAKAALITTVTDEIKEELKSKPKIEAFQQPVSHSTISSFSWEKAMEEAQQSLPTTVSCIWAMLQLKKIKKSEGNKRFRDNKSDLAQKAGTMLSIAFSTNPRLNKFVQSSLGIELLKEGATKKTFSILYRMGISQNMKSSRTYVNNIVKQRQQELLSWRESQKKTQSDQGSKDCPTPRKESYGFSYSRIQVGTEAKTPGHSNTQTVCFAVKDRVHFKRSVHDKAQVPATKLNPYTFLPSPNVFECQRSRAVFLVKHIITKHLTKLKHLKKNLPPRIVHSHIKEMDEKSQCGTLGTVDANPDSTKGMISVLERLQNYLPVEEDQPVPCLLSGDTERILDAQRHACTNEANMDDRLTSFCASPREFHKELLHVHESNKKFLRASSVTDRGTVAQVKKELDLRTFKNETTERYQNISWDLYEFVTESHILLCAMKFCGINSIDDKPHGFRKKWIVYSKLQWLTNLAHRVVDFCWSPPDRGDVHVAAAAFDEKLEDVKEEALRYCHCNTREKTDDMILCCSRACTHAWFHLGCLGLDKTPKSEDDWYCSKTCEKNGSYIYCFCHTKQPRGWDMVQCHLAEQCKKYVWYHQQCVTNGEDDPLPDTWYCSEECALGAEHDDHVLNHTKALMYEGLCHLVRRQAVRDGNGPAMVDDWKADMLTFHERNHPEYLVIGHYFLACVGGFADPETQLSLIWNRVANPNGKPGGNVGLDVVHECVNLDCTGVLRPTGGITSPDQLARWAQLRGPFGRDLDALFTGSGTVEDSNNSRTNVYDRAIQHFIKEHQADGLVDYIPGREHSAFGVFESSCQLQNPKQLGQKLQSLSTSLDMWDSITSSSMET